MAASVMTTRRSRSAMSIARVARSCYGTPRIGATTSCFCPAGARDSGTQLFGQEGRRAPVRNRGCTQDAGLDQRASRNHSARAWPAFDVRKHRRGTRFRWRTETDVESRGWRRRDAGPLRGQKRNPAQGWLANRRGLCRSGCCTGAIAGTDPSGQRTAVCPCTSTSLAKSGGQGRDPFRPWLTRNMEPLRPGGYCRTEFVGAPGLCPETVHAPRSGQALFSCRVISGRVYYMIEKRRPLFWEGSSKKDFKGFPVPVQKDMGVALFIAQLGQTAGSAKPWKGLGSGGVRAGRGSSGRHVPCGLRGASG